MQDETILETQVLYVDLADADFVERFYRERVTQAHRDSIDVSNTLASQWLDDLNQFGQFTDLIGQVDEVERSAERVQGIARQNADSNQGVLNASNDRTRLYTAMKHIADDAIARRSQAGSSVEREAAESIAKAVGQAALLDL